MHAWGLEKLPVDALGNASAFDSFCGHQKYIIFLENIGTLPSAHFRTQHEKMPKRYVLAFEEWQARKWGHKMLKIK